MPTLGTFFVLKNRLPYHLQGRQRKININFCVTFVFDIFFISLPHYMPYYIRVAHYEVQVRLIKILNDKLQV